MRKHKDPKALKVLNKIHQDNIKAQNELIEIQSSLRHSSHENIQRTLNYLSSKSVLQRYIHRCMYNVKINITSNIISARLFIGISLTLVTMGLGVAIIVYVNLYYSCVSNKLVYLISHHFVACTQCLYFARLEWTAMLGR